MTEASLDLGVIGNGSFGALVYSSTDVLNMATGQGQGSNVFRMANGDELWADFSVQLVPGSDAGQFSLFGDLVFTGGSGAFDGATGSANFSGHAQFFSASEAQVDFSFNGQISTVPEPASALLLGSGLLLALRRRYPSGASKLLLKPRR